MYLEEKKTAFTSCNFGLLREMTRCFFTRKKKTLNYDFIRRNGKGSETAAFNQTTNMKQYKK